jgi:DNA-binding response OmpR family regulator
MPQKKILVADDEESFRFALSLSLKMSGFQVETADNGREALDKILSAIEGKSPFDLLITDIRMPIMNGLELVERLGRAGIEIPVLVMSGQPWNTKISASLPHAGIAYYMAKPFNMEDMLRRVGLLLKNATFHNEKKE